MRSLPQIPVPDRSILAAMYFNLNAVRVFHALTHPTNRIFEMKLKLWSYCIFPFNGAARFN